MSFLKCRVMTLSGILRDKKNCFGGCLQSVVAREDFYSIVFFTFTRLSQSCQVLIKIWNKIEHPGDIKHTKESKSTQEAVTFPQY